MVSPVGNKGSKNYSTNEKALKKFVRIMIKNHQFVGSYLEKRYVFSLGCYKKIVKIAKNEEIFIDNLLIIKRRLEDFYKYTKWIGISCTDTPGAPVGFNIWVDIDEEIFGVYQFLVKDVLFSDNQVILKIDIIKPSKENNSFRELGWNTSNSDNSRSSLDECEKPILTWINFKNAMTFLFLLILTFITGGGHIIKYSLEYILKLLEISTPIIIALFNTVTKMFGYLCFLIAFLLKGDGSKNQGYVQNTQRIYYQPQFPYENRYKALQYKPKSSVVITELEE